MSKTCVRDTRDGGVNVIIIMIGGGGVQRLEVGGEGHAGVKLRGEGNEGKDERRGVIYKRTSSISDDGSP